MIIAKKNNFKTTLIALFLFSLGLISIDGKGEKTTAKHEDKKAFNPATFILEHIGDAYEWHIMTWEDKHISIPLPIILYSKHSGLNIFTSSKLNHGHSSYINFEIAHNGAHKGKIIERLPDGTINRPIDISITKNVTALILSLILIMILFISIAKTYTRKKNKPPKGLQSLLEPIILFIRDDIAKSAIGNKKHEKFMPFLLSIFFFIWINNLMGLIPFPPFGANLTGNISVTLVLAIFTFILTMLNGNKNYWQHIFNPPGVPWWLKLPIPLMPLIEFTGLLTKPLVLMIRLFANITAGHMIVLVCTCLIFIFGELSPTAGYSVAPVAILFSIFMLFLELLVALIQAYVFTLLSAIYFGMATEEHH